MFDASSRREISASHPIPTSEETYRKLKRAHVARLSLTYLAPFVVLTAYLYLQYNALVSEAERLHLRSVAESQASVLDLYLSERLVNVTNLFVDSAFPVPPTSALLESKLSRLMRDSEAFVDLGFLDASGVQVAYAGPYRSLLGRDYAGESWYRKLRQQETDHLVSDIYSGFRQLPHITLAARRSIGEDLVVLRAALDPSRLYDYLGSWKVADALEVSIVDRNGEGQRLTRPAGGSPLPPPLVPPRSARVGTAEVDLDGKKVAYAYAWLGTADWAVVVHPNGLGRESPLLGFRSSLLGLAAVMILAGLVVINSRARKLVEAYLETERTRAQLAERVKELDCLFGIGRLVEQRGASLEEILQGTVELVRNAWQYPDITCVRVTLDGRQCATTPWKETKWRQLSPIAADGEVTGRLEVCYMEERPEGDEGPFVNEERKLIDAVAERLGRVVARFRAEERRNMLATAVEDAAESIIITDIRGTIEYVNPAFTRISGFTREEVIGKNPRIVKSGQHNQAFYREMWQTILSGRTWEGRFTNKGKDGGLYQVDCRISPVRDERGTIIRFVALMHDVTELVRLESNLRQAQKMEAIGQLAGGVAHDFNNILTVILTNTHYLLRSVEPSSPLRQDVEEIQQSGERAASLTRQLLAFSRQQVVERGLLDLNEVLAGTEKMLRRLIGEDIELETLPASRLSLVYQDPAQIEQVIVNLAVNARDAMPEGGRLRLETAEVELGDSVLRSSGAKPGTYVMLKVTDTGCGMDEETRARIFDPFFTTKEHGKGTGLGLSSVYGIVTQGEGHIEVESELGKGTTFRIYFPRVAPAHDAELERESAAVSVHGSETVLVVEDDDSVRQTAVRILRDLGYRVLEARNGKEALGTCAGQSGRIDLLVTDVVMPEMSGSELRREITASFPGIEVMFMSGYSEQHASAPAADPATVFIRKPLVPDELAQRVREVLDHR